MTCSGPSPSRALRACTAVPLLTPTAVNSRFSAKEVTISSAPQAAARSIRDFRPSGGTMEHMDLLRHPPPQGGVQLLRKAGMLPEHLPELGEKVWASTPSSRSR